MKRRRVIQLVLLLVMLISGGAIVNVAVAWGCAVWVHARPSQSALQPNWPKGVPADWPISVFSSRATGVGCRFANATMGVEDEHGNGQIWMAVRCDAGFPFPSMYWLDYSQHRTGELTIHSPSSIGGILLNRVDFVRRRIPTTPLYAGFALNTLIYGGILYVLVNLKTFRRSFRRRRGLCPACAYPIGTSSVCTECGKELA